MSNIRRYFFLDFSGQGHPSYNEIIEQNYVKQIKTVVCRCFRYKTQRIQPFVSKSIRSGQSQSIFRLLAMIVKIIFVFLMTVATFVAAIEFPESIQRCRHGDSNCLLLQCETIHRIGIPSLGIGPLDPLSLEDFTDNIEVPLKVDFTISNSKLVGIQYGVITDVVGFSKDPKTSQFEIHGLFPLLTIFGDVGCSATLFNRMFKGQDSFIQTTRDSKFKIRLLCDTKVVNEKVYLIVKQTIYESTVSSSSMSLKNPLLKAIANGESGQAAWKIVFGVWLSRALQDIVVKVFHRFPYNDLFINN
ncbi:hypothetical protein Bhyg_06151 [Pseudolycoriella hygida]|uniref:Uncharacterized protein n=1 Tax=Pseudolycoriella hygida TaxID=35572 RepID=A0A9Q0N135_9DIPT|nr:hypothetical protein Bhyg_06151 [Pseudolycoriella hygida]